VHLLIEAFGQLMEKIPHNLILVGKPRRGEDRVTRSLKDLPNTARIQRVNSLTEVQLRFLYQNADLFVLPSAYEGFGLPILEALLAGIPVITTSHASLPEVGGEQVTYIEKNTANTLAQAVLATLTQDSSKREEGAETGKQWASSFSWRTSAEQTLRVIYSASS
jgi:glycosyltransferase involved in cell wall biosynthesis